MERRYQGFNKDNSYWYYLRMFVFTFMNPKVWYWYWRNTSFRYVVLTPYFLIVFFITFYIIKL